MTVQDVSELNARWGIPGQLEFKAGPGGLAVAEVTNVRATATIVLQGAHVAGWAPRDERPVIWVSPAARFAAGKSLRGGVPVCWPWFGAHDPSDGFPAHGFARTVPWAVTGSTTLPGGATRIDFRLQQDDATRALWPHATELESHITVGEALEIELVTRNTGHDPVTIGQALHTYFEVGDVERIRLQGLDGCPYLDKVEGFTRKRQTGPVRFEGETDRIYLDSIADCLIDDPVLGRAIRIGKGGSRSTVVWNPGAERAAQMGDFGEGGWRNMVCVESANAADDVVTVPPGGEHRLWVSYRVEPRS